MKTRTEILELTQDDLVDLFSTATYGSNWLSVFASNRTGFKIEETDCMEDIWAKALLAGKMLTCTDYNADEGEVYGTLEHEFDEDGHTEYLVTLQDIKDGLQKCADGTFKRSDDHYGENDLAYISECYRNFHNNHGEMDNPQAEALMQIILFGELIYG